MIHTCQGPLWWWFFWLRWEMAGNFTYTPFFFFFVGKCQFIKTKVFHKNICTGFELENILQLLGWGVESNQRLPLQPCMDVGGHNPVPAPVVLSYSWRRDPLQQEKLGEPATWWLALCNLHLLGMAHPGHPGKPPTCWEGLKPHTGGKLSELSHWDRTWALSSPCIRSLGKPQATKRCKVFKMVTEMVVACWNLHGNSSARLLGVVSFGILAF